MKISDDSFSGVVKYKKTFSSRAEAEAYVAKYPEAGRGEYTTYNNAGSTASPKWRILDKRNRKRQKERRANRSKPGYLTSLENYEKAERKAKKIREKGMEVHHITSFEDSDKIKSKMNDFEWEAKIKADAKNYGIYHGHHPRNLVATLSSNASKNRKGILHRAGGYHELDAIVKRYKKSGVNVGNTRDVMATIRKIQSRERKRNELGR